MTTRLGRAPPWPARRPLLLRPAVQSMAIGGKLHTEAENVEVTTLIGALFRLPAGGVLALLAVADRER